MSDEAELLALRRQLLVTRAALQRARVARDLHTLRECMHWPRIAATLLTSAPARSVLVTMLLMITRHTRLARVARIAGVAVALAQFARTILRNAPRSQGTDEGSAKS